jgi:hypothetical protein
VGSTSNNIKAISAQAGLTPEQQKQINGYIKAVDSHQKLTSLPSDVAKLEYAKLTPEQQKSLKDNFGNVEEKRGWLGTVLHYTVDPIVTAVATPIKLAFKGVQELSDLSTRAYRTAAIAVDQKVDIGTAWTTANDKGDKVFSPSRMAAATKIFGSGYMSVAQKVAEGMTLDQVIATGTEEEKQIASKAAQKQDPLFQDALDAANAAKYSPGRFLANAILPQKWEGSGAAYRTISGLGDAAFRIFTDPILALGKAKKIYDVSKYALDNIVGNAGNVEKAFQVASVQRFDRDFVGALKNYSVARKAIKEGAADPQALVQAGIQLKRIAPEFGDDVIEAMLKEGVVEAGTIKNFLAGSEEMLRILGGQAGRQVQLLPRMDLARQTRIAAVTTGNKLLRFDQAGRRINREIFSDQTTIGGIEAQLAAKTRFIDTRTGEAATANTPKEFLKQTEKNIIGEVERKTAKLRADGAFRMPLDYVQDRIDRFASKFAKVPFFRDNYFDPNAADSAEKVYQLARLANTRYNSRLFAEAFKAGDEAQKRQIMMGVFNTVAEIRGLNKVPGGKNILDKLANSSREQLFAPRILVRDAKGKPVLNDDGTYRYFEPSSFNDQQFAIFDFQLAEGMTVPKIKDLDGIVDRYQVASRIMAFSHKPWVESITSGWSFLTLAGPRFAVRNSIEDLMVHLAVGDSIWGIAAGKRLSTKLRLGQGGETLGVINKLIKRSDRDLYRGKLEAAKTVQDARKVMADAVMTDKYLGKLDPQAREIIAEMAEFGAIDELLAGVAEGGKKGITGADHWTDALRTVDKFGTSREYKIDGVTYAKQSGGNYREYSPITAEGKIAWVTSIAAVGNDPLGSIALQYMSDNPSAKRIAINKIIDFIDSPQYAKQKARYQLYRPGNNADVRVHAENVYAATRNLFVNSQDKVNQKLLAKVSIRTPEGGIKINTRDLGIDDLPSLAEDAPQFISGPSIMPIADGNPAGKLVGKHWEWVGEMNARWSREPMVLSAAVDMRKRWKNGGLEERYLKILTDPIENNPKLSAAEKKVLIDDARLKGKKNIIEITQDLAKERVLAYVDNPEVRTQLAFTMRNFARYYRATEDFYRRALRGVRYNPESIARLSLTYEGVSHSGFIQKDDQGEAYFIYPGMQPVYAAMSKLATAVGIKGAFVAPMPVEFGAKLNMITPSMNPESLFPTFSGPLAAFPLKMMYEFVPSLKESEKYLFGEYGEDQPIINAILPAHINRALGALNKDERDSQYASAFRKAVTYLEASGHGLKITKDANGNDVPPSPGELEDYQDKLKSTTQTILGMRFFSALVLPASPSVQLKSEMAGWVRDNERTSFKQVFSNLVTEYNGDYTRATEEWIKLFPQQMPYTVSESKKNTVAVIKYGEAAGNWVDNNTELLKKYPEAAAFLIPNIGKFSYDSYKTMMNEGFLDKKQVGDFLRETQIATDKQYYFQQRKDYLNTLASTTSVDQKRMINEKWDNWSRQFMAVRPQLQTEFASGGASDVRREIALNDLRNMLTKEKNLPRTKTVAVLRQMLQTYDSFNAQFSSITDRTDAAQDRKDALQAGAKAQLQELAASNPNTKSAYDVLFASLIGD